MGYDLHITHKKNWFDKGEDDIHLSEWLDIVQSDSEMRLDRFAEATSPNGDTIFRYESEGLSVWTTYSGHMKDSNMAWFDFRGGHVIVKNPDVEIRQKMYKIAQCLHARVQGDDGEYYGPDGEIEEGTGTEQQSSELLDQPRKTSKPWWKIW